MQFFLLLVLGLNLGFSSFMSFGSSISSSATDGCPLNFDFLRDLINGSSQPVHFLAIPTECWYMRQALRLVRSEYLRRTGYFFPPPNSSEACWVKYQSIVNGIFPGMDVRSSCRFGTSLISETCANVVTKSDFDRLVSNFERIRLKQSCNQSLEDNSACKSCRESLSMIQDSYFGGSNDGNESDCSGYPFIYAAAFANQFQPSNDGNVNCLFWLDFSSNNEKKRRRVVFWGIVAGCTNGLFMAVLIIWFCWTWRWGKRKMKRRSAVEMETENTRGAETANRIPRSLIVRFGIDEIKKATDNFSRNNIIGRGGYGNVYRGVLADGSEFAVKRFKNCSAAVASDETFSHEVEVIASVAHVNLVALRGYCTVTLPWEGNQRMIVCELMRNGSLFDHLFGTREPLDWNTRQNIAIGTARGLAYLHYGPQPAIIHRDIKASNILLDENYEPKLADFGLAMFTADGISHLSTKVAGTLGYVAPEYALYGQVSERSDVYSFGVVLLEILSGKKAVIFRDVNETILLADWAWTLARENRAVDVIDESILGLGDRETMEKYVILAVLCSHPLPQARPTMEQVMMVLETYSPLPSVPDCPASLILDVIEEGIAEPSCATGGSFLASGSIQNADSFMQNGSNLKLEITEDGV